MAGARRLACLPVLGLTFACGGDGPTEDRLAILLAMSPLPPAPPDPTNAVADDPGAAHFGRWLFFEKRLSPSGEFSCASCHDPGKGFGDGLPVSRTIRPTPRHAPTIYNTAHNRWFFWDGRADSHWAQALGPIENPSEMGGSRLEVAHRLHDDASLRQAYEMVFGTMPDLSDRERFPPVARPDPDRPDAPHRIAWEAMGAADRDAVNRIYSNVGKAIAAYERRILRADSPFDAHVAALKAGEAPKTLSESAQRGLDLFIGRANCFLCHNGPNLTDNEFHNLGLDQPEGLPASDPGRMSGIATVRADPFNGMGPYSDAPDSESARDKLEFLYQNPNENPGQFKTASLRNVAITAPYMHGGHFAALRDVVRFYSLLDQPPPPLGHRDDVLNRLDLSDAEVDDLTAFLESLTGEPLPEDRLGPPESPIP